MQKIHMSSSLDLLKSESLGRPRNLCLIFQVALIKGPADDSVTLFFFFFWVHCWGLMPARQVLCH